MRLGSHLACSAVGKRSAIPVVQDLDGLMFTFERLLVPGCTERPTCRCGEVMEVASIERLPEGSDAAIRVYRCTACRHEMRLTVWATIT